MRQVIRFRNPDGIQSESLPPVEVSFHWKRADGWIKHERTIRLNNLADTGRALWRKLFLSIETAEQLSDWENQIPQYECGCKQFYSDWKANNPPTFPLQPRWKYELKAAVNAKLGHQNITFEQACQQWNWNND